MRRPRSQNVGSCIAIRAAPSINGYSGAADRFNMTLHQAVQEIGVAIAGQTGRLAGR